MFISLMLILSQSHGFLKRIRKQTLELTISFTMELQYWYRKSIQRMTSILC